MRSLRKRCVGSEEESVAYRLDKRPPEEICRKGFEGTNNNWLNNVFSGRTVFASRSLKGISRFWLEAYRNLNADGSGTTGALSKSRHLYSPDDNYYVYKIDLSGLKYVDVSLDLSNLDSNPESSYIYKKSRENFRNERKELDKKELDDWYTDIKMRLSHYNKGVVRYTEEILIRGPVPPGQITCYQRLEKKPPYKKNRA